MKRRSKGNGDLFIEESRQLRMIDKSAEQQALEKGKVECFGMTFDSEEARRAYFTDRLREKLADPEFRKTPGFPKGTDEDILALSNPPYFTLCPNPFVNHFMRLSARQKTSPDGNIHAFSDDVSGNKHGSMYNVHPYHTKVPPEAIEPLVQHYTRPGDIILDPFCGTGMAGVAVESINSLNRGQDPRSIILSDISPIAAFIAGNYTKPSVKSKFDSYLQAFLQKVSEETEALYKTRHSGWPASVRDQGLAEKLSAPGQECGRIIYTVWSDVYTCPQCAHEFSLWDAAVDLFNSAILDVFNCPSCNSKLCKEPKHTKSGASLVDRASETWFDPILSRPMARQKRKPCLISYEHNGKRYEKFPDAQDVETIRVSDNLTPQLPSRSMMGMGSKWGDTWRSGVHSGITHVHHFFTNRTLQALSILRARHGRDTLVEFLVTSGMLRMSRLNRYMPQHRDNRNREVVGPLSGTLYVPSISLEINPVAYLTSKERQVSALAMRHGRAHSLTSVMSATNLSAISDASIDYIFTDPPFGDNLFYSELNQIWEWFIGVETAVNLEAVVSDSQDKGIREYGRLMRDALTECHRVLRPGRWLTMEFHNSKNAVWAAIQEALGEAGFVVADVRVLDKQKGTTKQLISANAVMKDLIISAYKPSAEIEILCEDPQGGTELIWKFVRGHLTQVVMPVVHGDTMEVVAERQPHLLFDRMLAFCVMRGIPVPVSAADFYVSLEQSFPMRDGMYFLSTQVSEYDAKRAGVRELGQLTLFVTDEASAIHWVRNQIGNKPQSFQDLQPQFMREMQSWSKHERTVELQEILEQNFLRYDGAGPVPSQIHSYLSSNFKDVRNLKKDAPLLVGRAQDRWYVPDPSKLGDIERLRERALLREFEVYKYSKERKLKLFRTEAVRAGFKAAYEGQDYKTIVSVAAKLPENVLQEDEKLLMYYDVASMRLGDE